MTNVEKLKAWSIAEKEKGLIDVKFSPLLPGELVGDPEEALEKLAGQALALLTGEGEDITHSIC
jgi:hypothetical protein